MSHKQNFWWNLCLKTIRDIYLFPKYVVWEQERRTPGWDIKESLDNCSWKTEIDYSQKLGYILKLVTLMYIPWIVIFVGFISAKISNNHKLLSYTNLLLLFYQPPPFFGEICTLPYFLENKQNSNPHLLCKVGETQLWLIKTTCFTYLLLQIKPVIIKAFNF